MPYAQSKTSNVHPVERAASLIGGGLLAFAGFRKRSVGGGAMVATGAEMLRRGLTGKCYLYQALGVRTASTGQGAETTSVPYELGVRVSESITINRPRAEVYNFWRELTNLPKFMSHLKSVKDLGGGRSHWVAAGPAGVDVEWDAEIINEVQNKRIAWRSLPGSTVDSAGSVRFRSAKRGSATTVEVNLQYNPPAGSIGAWVAKGLGRDPEREIRADLGSLKHHLESSETNQPALAGG
jgi:uncharacterized membrane protein